MSSLSKKDALKTLQWHYQRAASKSEKTTLLDAACKVLGRERKYVIKLLHGQRGVAAKVPRRRGGSTKKYLPSEIGIIKALWLLAEQPCGRRLHSLLPLWLPAWERRHGLIATAVRERLGTISASQLDRVLRPFKVGGGRPVRLGNQVRNQIPLRTGPREVDAPGWIEADTVAHCGGRMSGTFAWSLVLTDIDSGWTEAGATWNRSDRVVQARLKQIENSLPFEIQGFDTDNGGEFINGLMVRYFKDRPKPVKQTRSRPYHKNDNAHVEQKNRTHIRQLPGERRLEPMAIVEPLNELERRWCLWNNLYCPTLKLMRKERVGGAGGRLRRIYEKAAQTPAQRLLASAALSEDGRKKIVELLRTHDPIDLKEEIERRHRELWEMVDTLAAKTGS